jgi:hypothetical protein
VAEESKNGYEEELAEYETQLAHYLQERIKPGLTANTIPLVARSIAKEIARREVPEGGGGSGNGPAPPAFEAEMRELQAELGEDWILRFSVQGDDGWLTAEKQDASQRVEAPDAMGLIPIEEAINEDGGRRR